MKVDNFHVSRFQIIKVDNIKVKLFHKIKVGTWAASISSSNFYYEIIYDELFGGFSLLYTMNYLVGFHFNMFFNLNEYLVQY